MSKYICILATNQIFKSNYILCTGVEEEKRKGVVDIMHVYLHGEIGGKILGVF